MEPQHTYAVHAQKLGYSTVYMGKYLNQYGYGPADEVKVPAGWDHWLGLVGNSQYYNYSLVDGGVGRETKVQHFGDTYPEDYLPYVLKEHSLHFISTLPEPWLIVVAWPTPHAPFTPAPWAVDTMKDHHAPITANYNASDIYMQQKHWLLRQLLPMTKNTADKVDYYYRRRLEALKSVDEHVGLMVDKLDHLGRLEDTVIMYTSDNGFQFGQHRLSLDKRHLYENDIRVPFCIRGPGIPPNSQSSKIVANIDIAPTILDIIRSSSNSSASITLNAAKDSMDGSSIWKYVQGRGGNNDSFTNRHDLLITYHGEGQLPCGTATCPPVYGGILWMPDSFNNTYNCVRTYRGATDEDSIYCRFDDDENFVEFYDLNKNPYQLNNEYADLKDFERQRYEHRLNELMTCQGPTCRRRHHHVRGKEVTNS